MEIEISKNNYDKNVAEAKIPVLLDFWATWCGPCRMVAPELEKVANEFEGKLLVGKINVDEEPFLCEKFNIDVIPTLILIENGEEKKRFSGYLSKEDIEKTFDIK